MKSSAHKPKTKPGAEPKAKSDLQSMPMPELQAKLGSSPDGLTHAEAKKRLVQYGPNEIEEKKDNPFLKFLTGAGPALARFRHHPRPALGQRRGGILGRAPGGQRHRGAEGEAGG
jgi:magnesium-transporting ATPase (P-type)